jgi:hypothetical protein
VPTILAALDDPHKHSEKCLRMLLETAFIHVIDAPSLALIMPVLKRALTDRSTRLKKSAAQIIGNMYVHALSFADISFARFLKTACCCCCTSPTCNKRYGYCLFARSVRAVRVMSAYP